MKIRVSAAFGREGYGEESAIDTRSRLHDVAFALDVELLVVELDSMERK